MRTSIIATKGSGTESGRISWQTVICLLLGIFFLYNPFFGICPAGGPSASIQHHVSYRSTIASSELGCSNLQHSTISVVAVAALISAYSDRLRPNNDVQPRSNDEDIRPTNDGFSAPLWSRPPPVVA
jgi:hypothetical protein